jgi:thymidine kinase
MMSGKTSKLIELSNKYAGNDKVLAINHILNNRYNTDKIITHDKKNGNFDFEIKLDKLDDLIINEYFLYYQQCKIIVIDELQFFKNSYEFIYNAVEKDNKIIIASGLNGDSNKNLFGDIFKLIPISDDVIFLTAICKCGNKAIFSKRITEEKSQILVGNSNDYIPVCRECFKKTN